jgi:hypothetical protein
MRRELRFIRVLALLLAAGVFCGRAHGQAPRPAPPSLAAAADYLWKTILTTCTTQGETHRFYVKPGPDGEIEEFARSWTRVFIYTVTDADRRNGIELKGEAALGGSSSRTYSRRDTKWQEWEAGSEEEPPANISTVDQWRGWVDGHHGSFGLLVKLERRNGVWSFNVEYSNTFTLDTLPKATVKHSCAELTSTHPFAADDERSRKLEEEKRAAEAREEAAKVTRIQGLNSLERELNKNRDFGASLLCENTQLRNSLLFDDTLLLPRALKVRIVGATEKDGALGEWVRVKLPDVRFAGFEDYYFVAVSSLQDRCRTLIAENPNEVASGRALAEGVRSAGGLDAYTVERARRIAAAGKVREEEAVSPEDLPRLLQEALRTKAGPGLSPSTYEEAIQRATEIARLCSSISASDFAASIDQYGMPRLNHLQSGKFKECDGWFPVPEGRSVAGYLLVFPDLRQHWLSKEKQWDGPKLHVRIYRALVRGEDGLPFDKSRLLFSADIRDADGPGPLGGANRPQAEQHLTWNDPATGLMWARQQRELEPGQQLLQQPQTGRLHELAAGDD